MKPRISAVINTLNEEKNLPLALRSLQPWVDEIVVVDMNSCDRTVQIAQTFGAKVCGHPGPGFQYAPRAFALRQASCEWILVVDADELIPVALSRDLLRIAASNRADAVRLPRVNYLLGSAMRYTGWGPRQDYQLRFFKKGLVVGSSIAHRDFEPAVGAQVEVLPFRGDNAIIHFNYFDSSHFIDKMNVYTSIEAMQSSGKRASCGWALARAVYEFLSRYVVHLGFLDGWRGFYLSLLMVFYRVASAVKLKELRTLGPRQRIESRYRQEAEEMLKAYEQTPLHAGPQVPGNSETHSDEHTLPLGPIEIPSEGIPKP